MSILSDNLRYLRHVNKLSQRELGERIVVSRGRYSAYEQEVAEPPIDILKRLACYYHISIDLLVNADLQRVPEEEIRLVESIICKFR